MKNIQTQRDLEIVKNDEKIAMFLETQSSDICLATIKQNSWVLDSDTCLSMIKGPIKVFNSIKKKLLSYIC